jgi:hypothetical protein
MYATAEFDKVAADKALTAEQLGAIDQQDIPICEVDENDDGQISREEWTGYVEARSARAAEASEGKMSIADYTKWREGGMQP